jgi:acyl-CoA thioester hydrolase
MSTPHHLAAQIYYEDTDHSGAVYHANYLKYYERAREAVIGVELLVNLWEQHTIGFAVYKADLTYFDAAQFGDILDIQTTPRMDGKYRIIWQQDAWRPNATKVAVAGRIELVCLKNAKLIEIPAIVSDKINSYLIF